MFFAGRVELRGLPHDHAEYERLHEAMEARGFFRTIRAATGTEWHLPPAEYCHFGNTTLDDILQKAGDAVRTIGRSSTSAAAFFQCEHWGGFGLKEV